MNNYKIHTTLFGELEIAETDGIQAFFDMSFDGRPMSVTLNISDGFLNDENIGIVHSFIEEVPNLYAKGMNRLLEVKDFDESIKFFMRWHLDELKDKTLKLFEVDSIDKINSERFIKLLSLRTINIALDADNEIDCTLDFSFPSDCFDNLLTVSFDEMFEIYDISHESRSW